MLPVFSWIGSASSREQRVECSSFLLVMENVTKAEVSAKARVTALFFHTGRTAIPRLTQVIHRGGISV